MPRRGCAFCRSAVATSRYNSARSEARPSPSWLRLRRRPDRPAKAHSRRGRYSSPLPQNGKGPRSDALAHAAAPTHPIQLRVATPPSDGTLARLAARLVERDLLKRVPLSSERISEFFLRRPESWPRILDIVARYCDGDPEYFVSLDIPHFSLLETSDSNCAYLVDIRSPERTARRVRDHALFRDAESGAPTRLFVPHEAVGEVRNVIQAGG